MSMVAPPQPVVAFAGGRLRRALHTAGLLPPWRGQSLGPVKPIPRARAHLSQRGGSDVAGQIPPAMAVVIPRTLRQNYPLRGVNDVELGSVWMGRPVELYWAMQQVAEQRRTMARDAERKVCVHCDCYSYFEGMTDECCLSEVGKHCVFEEASGRSGSLAAANLIATGSPASAVPGVLSGSSAVALHLAASLDTWAAAAPQNVVRAGASAAAASEPELHTVGWPSSIVGCAPAAHVTSDPAAVAAALPVEGEPPRAKAVVDGWGPHGSGQEDKPKAKAVAQAQTAAPVPRKVGRGHPLFPSESFLRQHWLEGPWRANRAEQDVMNQIVRICNHGVLDRNGTNSHKRRYKCIACETIWSGPCDDGVQQDASEMDQSGSVVS